MEIKISYPRNERLKKLIECYYFIKRTPSASVTSYLSFPSVNTCVSVIKSASIKIGENQIRINSGSKDKLSSLLIGNYSKPVFVEYKGELEEISIIFKPLGVNAFLKTNFIDIAPETINTFNPFPDYHSYSETVFKQSPDEARIEFIEKYWLDKHIGFSHPFLQVAIDELCKAPDDVKMEALSRKNNITGKTLIKHFRRHLAKSPAEFRNSLRLQTAIKNKPEHRSALTSIAMDSGFFDQSHMIKTFRKLTGLTPKDFYKSITPLGKNTINWLFM